MNCPKCGLTINGHASKCPRCLTKIPQANQNIAPQISKPSTSNSGSSNNSTPPPNYQQGTQSQTGQQTNTSNPGYYQPQANSPKAIAALICGILGVCGGLIPTVQYFTLILAIIATAFGNSERKKAIQAGQPSGMATAGMILGIIGVTITAIAILVIAYFAGSLYYWFRSLFGGY